MTDTIERESYARARSILFDYDLEGLLARHEQAVVEYMEARRQHAEVRRQHQDVQDRVDEAKIDALAEMEQDPEYVPGKNAEARKLQAAAYLEGHAGIVAAKHRERIARQAVDDAVLAADHARARVDHLELQIAARRTELDLIASFARGAS